MLTEGNNLSLFLIYALGIGANLAYSSSSMVFSIYAKRFNPGWINQINVTIAGAAFLLAMLISQTYVNISGTALSYLLLSGFAGLCVGDIFVFRAFTTLGPARSLILYSFQPLIVGLYGYSFLGQVFTANQTIAVICMMICVFIFMLERNRSTGSWDIRSFIWAGLGIALDAISIMLSREAYEVAPDLQSFQTNFIRCVGAIVAFILISPKSYKIIAKDLKELPKKEISLISGAAFCGCFLSLSLYMTALKFAHVGTLTAISITGPVWVSLLESIYHRKMPNIFLLGAFAFFILGFYLMVTA